MEFSRSGATLITGDALMDHDANLSAKRQVFSYYSVNAGPQVTLFAQSVQKRTASFEFTTPVQTRDALGLGLARIPYAEPSPLHNGHVSFNALNCYRGPFPPVRTPGTRNVAREENEGPLQAWRVLCKIGRASLGPCETTSDYTLQSDWSSFVAIARGCGSGGGSQWLANVPEDTKPRWDRKWNAAV